MIPSIVVFRLSWMRRVWFSAAPIFVVGMSTSTFADRVEAEDVSYRMAETYIGKNFAAAPTDNSGVLAAGESVQFLVPVVKGLNYVLLAGTDAMSRDADVYVYDEMGGLLLDDRRRLSTAGVQFRSPYTGAVIVHVHMAKAHGQGSWSLLVGRRGMTGTNASPVTVVSSSTVQHPALASLAAIPAGTQTASASQPQTVKNESLTSALSAPSGSPAPSLTQDEHRGSARASALRSRPEGLGDSRIIFIETWPRWLVWSLPLALLLGVLIGFFLPSLRAPSCGQSARKNRGD